MTCSGMRDFAAIDFETANNERASVCSVGVVIVRGGEIVDKFYSLIKPEPEYYKYWCSQVHGYCNINAIAISLNTSVLGETGEWLCVPDAPSPWQILPTAPVLYYNSYLTY